MTDDLTDNRRAYEPDGFSFRELPANEKEYHAAVKAVIDRWREDGYEFFRLTVVSEDIPNPPYPDGLYFEAWKVDPARRDPPGKQAPFNYPLVAHPST